MNELAITTSEPVYVEPHYIEELGCDGLTATEIAKSLGVKAEAIRRKLDERGEYDRIAASGSIMTTVMMVNINGLEFTEYLLSTAAAKLFIARYKVALGDGYLKNLLYKERVFDRIATAASIRGTSIEALADALTGYLFDGASKFTLENEQLKKECELREKEGEELVSREEAAFMSRIMHQRLKIFGRGKPKHRYAFALEVMNKFYQPTEEKDTFRGLQRKNWKHVLDYINNREWSLREMCCAD